MGTTPQNVADDTIEVLSLVASSGAVSPKRMQLICLEICNHCRQGANWGWKINSVSIDKLFPSVSLTSSSSSEGKGKDKDKDKDKPDVKVNPCSSSSRLSRHRNITSVVYALPLSALCSVTLPVGLKKLVYAGSFDQPMRSFPSALVELVLGGCFNEQIEDMIWPPGLETIRLGYRFNRPIRYIMWPPRLQTLEFGECFDQPVEDVLWPPLLRCLFFGDRFNQPVARVAWSASLETLKFGRCFDQPINDVAWPPCLRILYLGDLFSYPLDTSKLPKKLRMLLISELYEEDEDAMREGLPLGCKLHISDVCMGL